MAFVLGRICPTIPINKETIGSWEWVFTLAPRNKESVFKIFPQNKEHRAMVSW